MSAATVQIRRGVRGEADVAAVVDIVRTSGFFDELPDEAESAEADVREALAVGEEASGSAYLFAELDGRIVGFASFGRLPCATTYMIHWIAVKSGLRGHGVGKALMRAALAALRAAGAKKVFLQTSGRPQYAPSRGFYLATGFAREAELKDYYIPGESCEFYSQTF